MHRVVPVGVRATTLGEEEGREVTRLGQQSPLVCAALGPSRGNPAVTREDAMARLHACGTTQGNICQLTLSGASPHYSHARARFYGIATQHSAQAPLETHESQRSNWSGAAGVQPLSVFTEEEEMLRDMVRKFAQEQVTPLSKEMDHTCILDKTLLQRLFDQRFMSVSIPEEHGGAGMSFTQCAYGYPLRAD